ncbi:peroxiredoxin [Pontibacter akesuensis]|uniref:thioredoxin-dependent peroxiredoxin n=1 Tax=Pontibacter akesuensis TaxID=388950 RepID=A0A1I7KH45_9BACT|nr:peroxiredoxin [Pontibacter akesuensis]GHA79083.1 peroxiredoxin [Pontibacter akesuensis]SFU96757.1 peroxiredoxin Q/BCP [Pontibacter akesuensis]
MRDEVIKVGDKAPDFELRRQDGGLFRLYDILKEKNVVLYFYPKDSTSGCTKQACEFRDQYESFQEEGAEVVGISSDSIESHQRFEQTHQLPFKLLSDDDGNVRRLFGVPRILGLLPGRVTYIIDQCGMVRFVHNSLMKPLEHVSTALEVLQEINGELKKQTA